MIFILHLINYVLNLFYTRQFNNKFQTMNFFKKNTGILLDLDDIAENMNWGLMDKCESLFEKHNIKPVVGVIPPQRY